VFGLLPSDVELLGGSVGLVGVVGSVGSVGVVGFVGFVGLFSLPPVVELLLGI